MFWLKGFQTESPFFVCSLSKAFYSVRIVETVSFTRSLVFLPLMLVVLNFVQLFDVDG